MPFYHADRSGVQQVAGIVDVSLTLGQFQELVGSIDLGRAAAGYGFIASNDGVFIYHPINAGTRA